MFEANFLTILVKPSYEKPIDTAEDVMDRGLSVIYPPGTKSALEILKNSPSTITRTLAERTTVCKDWDECNGNPFGSDDGLIPAAVKTGSSVLEAGILYPWYFAFGKWHRSKESRGGQNPFASYMLNKKWTLEEEFNNHLLRFQQVRLCFIYSNKLYFDIPGWIDNH